MSVKHWGSYNSGHDMQLDFDFYWECRRTREGLVPYGFTHEFWAYP